MNLPSAEIQTQILATCRQAAAAGARLERGRGVVQRDCCCALGAFDWVKGRFHRPYQRSALDALGVGPEWAEAFAAGWDGEEGKIARRLERDRPVPYRMGREIYATLAAEGLAFATVS